jgi:hydrogenase expression/formation protein HypD
MYTPIEPLAAKLMTSARDWIERIGSIVPRQPVRVMNVCGGHERTIAMAGLRAALPASIELIAGPGCPVCVCPEEDIHAAIGLAMRPGLILATFGDMIRVPANGRRSDPRSLQDASAAGATVRPVASPRDAMRIALANPEREVVFFAAGFETTMAPVAAMLAEGVPQNLSVLLAGRLTWPAVAMLLGSDAPGFDALIAPGHVATIAGPEEWTFVAERHGLPVAVAGFAPEQLLGALYAVLRQRADGEARLENCYGEVVKPGGNATARRVLEESFVVGDARWRGIGTIAQSGYALRPELGFLDAGRRHNIEQNRTRKRAGEMPPGCDCARVVLGRIRPQQCVLYGRACTPSSPVGPCMVSDEGACRIAWSSGIRAREAADK